MKSLKPGRGPSMMGGIGSVCSVIFGLIWTIFAASITSGFGLVGIVFPLFGVLFMIIGAVNAVYHFKNASSKNRYSVFDITEQGEEPDPLAPRTDDASSQRQRPAEGTQFCPYCGAPVQHDFAFCRKCGRELPKE